MLTVKSSATVKSRSEKLARDMRRSDELDIRDSFSSYRRLVKHDDDRNYVIKVQIPLLTKHELERDPSQVFNNFKNGIGGYWDVITKEEVTVLIDDLNIDENIKYCLSQYWNVYHSYDYIEVIAPYIRYVKRLSKVLYENVVLSFSEWCEAVEFIDNNRRLDNADLIWLLNVPEWLESVIDEIVNYDNWQVLSQLIDELSTQYNLHQINENDVINLISLFKGEDITEVIEYFNNVTIDYSLFSYLLPILVKLSKKRPLKYQKLNKRPYWCDKKEWQLFQNNKAYKGAKLIHQIAQQLIKQYSPDKYFYVCMARDAVPLYVLLFESGYDSMLGIFSRTQIGDDASVALLKNEIAQAAELTGKVPLLVDVQGRGTIYDYLKQEGILYDMIFAVCNGTCRYPVLFDDSDLGSKAIKYIEKLPQNNGRAEGVYQRSRCGNTFQDTLIVWGTRDPNSIGGEMKDWEILQFRGLFLECMGVSHVHAGMIGNDNQQRLWGVRKNKINIPSYGVGIKVKDKHLPLIKSSRFKSQHEVGYSNGHFDTDDRLRDEEKQFGDIGIRTIFGIIEDDKERGYQYGRNFCKLNVELLAPYVTITPEDSLWSQHDHYPLGVTFELPDKEGSYRELQINTLVTWDHVLEVIQC